MNLHEALAKLDAPQRTPKPKRITEQQVTDWALAHDYKLVFGHPRRVMTDHNGASRTYRIKANDLKVRFEIKCGQGWAMIRSAYYRDIHISKDGQYLIGVTRPI